MVEPPGSVGVDHASYVPIVSLLFEKPFERAFGGRAFCLAHLKPVQREEAGCEGVSDLPRDAVARDIRKGRRATLFPQALQAGAVKNPVLQRASSASSTHLFVTRATSLREAQEALIVLREAGSEAPRLRPLPTGDGRQ